ncbi:hypothetical protein D3C85_1384910 [compost metagenome]
MIKPVVGRLEGGFQLGEVHNPARVRIDFTGNFKTHHKGVTVQTTAFMAFRDMRQVVGSFEHKIFKQGGGHH